ncbi:hypothetical protein INS90_09680 [Trueperella pecoris]|uniref:Uncharacterized protein n=1 Tax=Trueperella pecoris TaxID=2733571 RepID=A0A7M1QZJ0_9ACTO|nr:hypothetical protein [Trueperella pecoris]QOR47502.1 hypothetical protein INS90_09680 [Trueperella pecoris]
MVKKLVSPTGFNVTVPDSLEEMFISNGYKQPGEEPKQTRAKRTATSAK